MKPFALAAALCLAASALTASAQPLKPEKEIQLRQSAYALMGYNFANLGAMAQDKKPYNKDEAIRDADFVALLATEPRNHFLEGTDKGRDTKAKPEIWQKRSDFDSKMDKMVSETGKLPAVARNGDLAALKAAVGETGKACKACHDEYRQK